MLVRVWHVGSKRFVIGGLREARLNRVSPVDVIHSFDDPRERRL